MTILVFLELKNILTKNYYKSKRLDLATNALTRTFPTGAMAEVVRVSALEKVLALTRDPIDLEHVTRYIYRNATTFCLENLYSNDPTLKDVSLAIDTKEDLARTRWVFRIPPFSNN